MSSNGKFIAALGVGSFLIAGLAQWLKLENNTSGGLLNHLLDGFWDEVSITFAILGVLIILCALFVRRRDRKLREFEEALKQANEPARENDGPPKRPG